jgi:hypothetical protein
MSLSVTNDNHEENLEVHIIVFSIVGKGKQTATFALQS